MKTLTTVAITLLVVALAALGYIYSGVFDVAADQPHGTLVHWLAETTRERSIAVRAIGIDVPDLETPALIAQGAQEYGQMCAGCHLGPGVDDNEFRQGLYPVAPELALHEHEHGEAAAAAAQQFWIVKHGIKMSAMPAWGITHDDATIWSIVAFLRKLPELTAQQYAQMTAAAAAAQQGPGHEHAGE